MVVCSGGSQIRANVPEALSLTWDYMASLYPAELQVLVPFLPYIKPVSIESVSSFCSSEPPGWPTLTGLTIAAVLAGGEVGAGLVVAEALTQIALNGFWYAACECIGATTPAPPATPSLPTVPILNPPVVVQPSPAGYCGTYGPARAILTSNVDSFIVIPLQQNPTTWAGTFAQGVVPVAAAAKTYSVNIDPGPLLSGGPHTADVYVVSWTAAGAFIRQDHYALTSGTILIDGAAVVATTAFMSVYATGYNDPGAPHSITIDTTLSFNCAQTPLTPLTPCCPPDPVISGVLTQILNLVSLIQRQAAPFSYVYGANHTGLTGTDEIAVADLVGVSVDVTSVPGYIGLEAGTPDTLFDIGWINLGTTDGWTSSRRIDHDGSLLLPSSAGVFTRVGYTLNPGVEVSIRELVREP